MDKIINENKHMMTIIHKIISYKEFNSNLFYKKEMYQINKHKDNNFLPKEINLMIFGEFYKIKTIS